MDSKNKLTSRTILKVVIVLIFSAFIFSACNKDYIETDKLLQKSTFFGLKIDLTNELVTETDLKKYELQEKSFLENKKSKYSAELNKDYENISDKKLFDWIDNETKKYPNLDNDLPSKSELAYINKIFSEIKTSEDYLKNKSIIFDYINLVVSINLKVILKTDLLKNKKAKILHNPDGSKNYIEITNAISDPVYSLKVKNAADEADQMCKEIFNNNNVALDGNDYVNSIRHAAWNMLSVSKIAQASLNKWKGLKHAECIITAHEYDDVPGAGAATLYIADYTSSVMDGYNNLVGRTYCYNVIGQTLFGNAKDIPSYNKIKTDIQAFTHVTVTNYNQIYGLGSPSLTNSMLLDVNDAAYDYYNSSISQKLVHY